MTKPPNLFHLLGGEAGELVSSAVLSYLLEAVPGLRDEILQLLCGQAPHPFEEGMRVERERALSASGSAGRIDLWVESGAAVMCVENKHWAQFGEDQLLRYAREANDVAWRKGGLHQILVVLAPHLRLPQFQMQGTLDPVWRLVSWESLLGVLEKWLQRNEQSPHSQLIREFAEWMKNTVLNGSLDVFLSSSALLQWNKEDRSLQRRAIDKLSNFLPRCNQWTKGTNWYVGYWFGEEHRGARSWMGFVANDRGKSGGCELRIYSMQNFDLKHPCERIEDQTEMVRKFLEIGDKSGPPGYCWRIDFAQIKQRNDGEWWHELLNPLRTAASVIDPT